jgi:type I site-specific restriction endonuclease
MRGGLMEDNDDFWGPVISKYTAKDAVEDGIFVEVGSVGKNPVYFTTNLFESGGYQDYEKRVNLVKRGLDMLNKEDPEDSDYMRLRVIEKDEIWVVYNGEGITFMKPEDY